MKFAAASFSWKNFFAKVRGFYLLHPVASFILTICFVVGLWLRLYHLPATMMFQGDQGRDALVVADIWREWDPVFIGPVTSVGNMYLGPFYYYFMLPFLWLSYPSPIGPTIAVAIINSFAILLMYFCGRRLVGSRAALLSSFLFTFSSIAISYSRFSWNPNLSAVFSLLTLYFIHRALTRSPKNWYWVALLAGILIQLHYVNLIMVTVAGLAWLWQLWSHRRQHSYFRTQKFWQHSLLSVLLFALTTVPLWLFDMKHGWLNLQALGSIFTAESSFADANLFQSVFTGARGLSGRIAHIFTTLTFPNIECLSDFGIPVYWLRVAFGIFCLLTFALFVYRRHHGFRHLLLSATIHERDQQTGLTLLLTTAIITCIAMSFYRHSVFDHYLLFFLPILFWILSSLVLSSRHFSWRAAALFTLLLCFFALNYPADFFAATGQPYAKTQSVARFITDFVPTADTFDFILIDNNGDLWGEHYRYFFTTLSDRILPHDRFLDGDHFFVIDETHSVQLYDNPSYELVVFRNQPDATYEALLTPPDWPAIYHFYHDSSIVREVSDVQ